MMEWEVFKELLFGLWIDKGNVVFFFGRLKR